MVRFEEATNNDLMEVEGGASKTVLDLIADNRELVVEKPVDIYKPGRIGINPPPIKTVTI